jgi:hypothetical protein
MSKSRLDRKAFTLYNIGAKAVDKQKPSQSEDWRAFEHRTTDIFRAVKWFIG